MAVKVFCLSGKYAKTAERRTSERSMKDAGGGLGDDEMEKIAVEYIAGRQKNV
jgi:hypothetical protein